MNAGFMELYFANYRGDLKKHLDLISKAADSMCQGDLVDRAIRTTQRWSLLPTQVCHTS